MKRIFFFIMIFTLWGCSRDNSKIDFPQSVLSAPTSIKVVNGESEMIFMPDKPEFSEIFKLIEQNWWKTIRDANEPPVDSNFKDMDAPIKILNSFTEENFSEHDVFVYFYYTEPIKWRNVINRKNEGDLFNITSYIFLLNRDFTDENHEGIMLISEDENILNKSNMYVYYYNKSLMSLIERLFEG